MASDTWSNRFGIPEAKEIIWNNHIQNLKNTGDFIYNIQKKWYWFLILTILTIFFPIAFLIPILVSLSRFKGELTEIQFFEIRQRTTLLITVSCNLTLLVILVAAVGIHKSKKYPAIKVQGIFFIYTMLFTSALCLISSWLCFIIPLWSSEFYDYMNQPTVQYPFYLRTISTALVISTRYFHTVFMALLAGRIRVIYKLFIRSPIKKYSDKENNKTLIFPLFYELALQTVTIIPFVAFSVLLYYNEYRKAYRLGFIISFAMGFLIVVLFRALVYLYYIMKIRHVHEVFSNFISNFRTCILSVLLWITGTILLIWSKVQVYLFVVPFASLQILVLSYIMDHLLLNCIFAFLERRRKATS